MVNGLAVENKQFLRREYTLTSKRLQPSSILLLIDSLLSDDDDDHDHSSSSKKLKVDNNRAAEELDMDDNSKSMNHGYCEL